MVVSILHQADIKRVFIALDEDGCVSPETAATMTWTSVPTDPGDILLFGSLHSAQESTE